MEEKNAVETVQDNSTQEVAQGNSSESVENVLSDYFGIDDESIQEDTQEESSDESEKLEDPNEKQDEVVEETQEQNNETDEDKLTLGKFKSLDELEAYVQKAVEEKTSEKQKEIEEKVELEKKESEFITGFEQIKSQLTEIQNARVELKTLLTNDKITLDQYTEALDKVKELELSEILKAQQLQKNELDIKRPKIKQENDVIYQNLVNSKADDFKNPIVKKYADKLKADVFDLSATPLTNGFESYVNDFIISSVKEAELAGYQRALQEIENAKIQKKMQLQTSKETTKQQPKSEQEVIIKDYFPNLV